MARNEKLFKKLNERVEINSIKNSTKNMTEAERANVEKKVVFEGLNSELAAVLDFTDSK